MSVDVNSEVKVIDLIGCARCHGDGHPGLVFKPLTHPVQYPGVDHPLATHWATCPTNGEPIFLGTVMRNDNDNNTEDI